MLLSKLVLRLPSLAQTDDAGFDLRKDIADAFTAEEIETIADRFAALDAALRTETDQFVPGFQNGSSLYAFNDMPEGFGVDEFIASWGAAT